MGLFGSKKNKEIRKNAEWKQALVHTIVELNEDHMKLITPSVTDTIFYKDIMNVEVVLNVVNIKTNVKTFSLNSRKLRGGSEKAEALYNQILLKMSENK